MWCSFKRSARNIKTMACVVVSSALSKGSIPPRLCKQAHTTTHWDPLPVLYNLATTVAYAPNCIQIEQHQNKSFSSCYSLLLAKTVLLLRSLLVHTAGCSQTHPSSVLTSNEELGSNGLSRVVPVPHVKQRARRREPYRMKPQA